VHPHAHATLLSGHPASLAMLYLHMSACVSCLCPAVMHFRPLVFGPTPLACSKTRPGPTLLLKHPSMHPEVVAEAEMQEGRKHRSL
jgi:hypothetical protein